MIFFSWDNFLQKAFRKSCKWGRVDLTRSMGSNPLAD
jgi:hypothetical protein